MTQQVQMVPAAPPQPKMKVYYEGTDTLYNGYLLCGNSDYGTAATATPERMNRAEKPGTTNLHAFLGAVVGLGSAGKAGPGMFTVARPIGLVADLFTDANCTINSTRLYLQPSSYLAGASGTYLIGTALQTIDRSSTNGLVSARFTPIDPAALSYTNEINSSTTFTAAIWSNFPVAEMRKNRALGTFLEYDPTFNPSDQIPERAEYTGAHNSVTETHVAATTLAAIERNLVLSCDASVADNDACAVQFPGPVVLTGGKPWAFEVDYDLTTVTNADMESLVGLVTAETLADEVPFADGGGIAATIDGLFFDIKADAGNSIDVSYVATGETAVLHEADVGTPTANAAITVGAYYNGTTIQTYVNGTAQTAISAADIADVTSDVFPAAVTCYLTAAIKGDSGVADGDDLNIRAFRVCQPA